MPVGYLMLDTIQPVCSKYPKINGGSNCLFPHQKPQNIRLPQCYQHLNMLHKNKRWKGAKMA